MIRVYISLGLVTRKATSVFSSAVVKFTYAFKRKDGLVFIGGIEASSRQDAKHKIRRKHLLEFGEIAGNDIPAIETTFEIKEIVRWKR